MIGNYNRIKEKDSIDWVDAGAVTAV